MAISHSCCGIPRWNARNALSRVRPPLQREIIETELDGPLGKKVRFLVAGGFYTSDEKDAGPAPPPPRPVGGKAPTPQHTPPLFWRLAFFLSPDPFLTCSRKIM